MTEFRHAMTEFHNSLRRMDSALADAEGDIKAVWNDAAFREFQRLRAPFEGNLSIYLAKDAPKFDAFINSRLKLLQKYLAGG